MVLVVLGVIVVTPVHPVCVIVRLWLVFRVCRVPVVVVMMCGFQVSDDEVPIVLNIKRATSFSGLPMGLERTLRGGLRTEYLRQQRTAIRQR